MKNISKSILITTLIVNSVFALKDTQKTELILRDHRHRAANFTTFHELKSKKAGNCETKFQKTGFYNETQSSKNLGEVFGACGKNCITVGTASQVTLGTADVENNFLLRNAEDLPENNTLQGTIKFNPKRTTFGACVEALVKLNKILKGLYFKENIAFMWVEHDLNVKFCDEKTGSNPLESHRLFDVLSGKSIKRVISSDPLDPINAHSEQEALKYAKITCGNLDRTGLSNIESILGWRFLDKKDYYLGINLAVHAPTGDRPTGEYLWEPRLGSQHWALGGGAEVGATLWENKKQSIKIFANAQYRYLFDETEKRTLGIKGVLTQAKYSKHILSHYYLLAENKKYTLHPAANILTKDVEVSPDSQAEGFIVLNYNCGKLVIDLGYDIFWKEKESVKLNSCNWTDNKYAIANFSWKTAADDDPFTLITSGANISDTQPLNTPINFCNIDTSVAQTPSITSHSIFGSVGYIIEKWTYPIMLGLGGAYEFGDGRASADSFTAWLKWGLAF